MREKKRRLAAVILFAILSVFISLNHDTNQQTPTKNKHTIFETPKGSISASEAVEEVDVKGRASKTGYARTQFMADWADISGCDVRNLILKRDLTEVFIEPLDGCKVIRGELYDPYTGRVINFQRGAQTSQAVQIDHVVALSDAWQKGAQQLSQDIRNRFANDPLNLLAVDGPANQKKSDGDAATWLPPNKSYRCRYVARQIAVKLKYHLWVTFAEKDAIKRQLQNCPGQVLPIESNGP
jgi:hypothetical protein